MTAIDNPLNCYPEEIDYYLGMFVLSPNALEMRNSAPTHEGIVWLQYRNKFYDLELDLDE